jgi:DNA-binding XRE family transcriptional regulator
MPLERLFGQRARTTQPDIVKDKVLTQDYQGRSFWAPTTAPGRRPVRPVALNTTLAQQRRKELGLSLHQAARLIGVTHVALLRWEAGQTEPRSLDSLQKWAQVLGVKTSDLLPEPRGDTEAEVVNG